MRTLAILGGIVSITATCALPVHAQSRWSPPYSSPSLWQIIAVDESGEPGWPYGSEDIAGDGLVSFEDDEAETDLRTVYADADADRLWIRAYFATERAPSDGVIVYFFIDSDDRDDTGGDAEADELWPELTADPTSGGYEHAIAARSDATVEGAWRWNAQAGRWDALMPPLTDGSVDIGAEHDPIQIGGPVYGFVQLAFAHDVTGLDSSCNGNIFVRTWHDSAPNRAFGDDDDGARTCRPTLDIFGDPDVLREPGCDQDDDCPVGGRCRERVCLFAYDCSGTGECLEGHRCTAGACVRVVDRSCDADSDCFGLVCRAGDCVACAENGAQACEDALLCSPNGQCVDPERGAPAGGNGGGGGGSGSSGRGGAGGASGGMTPPGKVRGGAFQCAAAVPGRGDTPASAWWLAIALALAGIARSQRVLARSTRAARTKRPS